MKVSINLKSFKNVEDNIRLSLWKAIRDPKLLRELSETIIKDIQVQTRMGKSIPNDLQPFKPLSSKRHPFLFGIYGALGTSKTLAGKKGFGRRQSNAIDEHDADGYSYTDIRDAIGKATPTHKAFSPKRSNLTITGQLLNSLKYMYLGNAKFKIVPDGEHEPYKIRKAFGESMQVGKKIENSKLAQYVAQQGRPFMGIRDSLIPRLKRIIIGYVRRSSKVKVKTKNNE